MIGLYAGLVQFVSNGSIAEGADGTATAMAWLHGTEYDSTGPACPTSVAEPLKMPPQSYVLFAGVSATGRCVQWSMSFETAWYQLSWGMEPAVLFHNLHCAWWRANIDDIAAAR